MVSLSDYRFDQAPRTSLLHQGRSTLFHEDIGYADRPDVRYSDHREASHSPNFAPETDTAEPAGVNELPAGTYLLRNQYYLEGSLQEGGFGITYLARDSLERRVVIKECFPEMLCCRVRHSVATRSPSHEQSFQSVIANFLKEARRLARLEHPNIVDVHQVFEENGTAYMAMDYVEGVDLLTLLEDCPERLTSETLQTALRDTLHALTYIHGHGILHRDISPDNIMLNETGHVTLIDFGAARDNFVRRDRALTALLAVKDGYSPHEFYLSEADQQASSDLYSLAATFYHLISGEAPPDSQKRVASIASGKLDPYRRLSDQDLDLDPVYLETIDKCLSISQRDRIQSAEEWLNTLNKGSATLQDTALAAPEGAPEPEAAPEQVAVDLTDSVVGSIAALVEATNKDVAQASKVAPEKTPTNTGRLVLNPTPQSTKVRQLVDLFGNPIDDLDTWLKEQDRLLAAKDAADRSAGADVDYQSGDEQDASRGSMFAFFARIFRPSSVATSRAQV